MHLWVWQRPTLQPVCTEGLVHYVMCAISRYTTEFGMEWEWNQNLPLTRVTSLVSRSSILIAWLLVSATSRVVPPGATHRPPGSENWACSNVPLVRPVSPVPASVVQTFVTGFTTLIWYRRKGGGGEEEGKEKLNVCWTMQWQIWAGKPLV